MTIKDERLGCQATMSQAVKRSDVDSTGSCYSAEGEKGEEQHHHNSFSDSDDTGMMSQARRQKVCEQCTCQDTRALRRLRTTSTTTTCSRRASSSASSSSPTSVIASLTLLLLLHLSAVSARHQAKVHSSQCSYTLVVNEFDVSKCPTMQADAQTSQSYQWSRDSHRPAAAALMSGDAGGSTGGFTGGARGVADPDTSGQGVDVLKSQVRDLEGRLLEEMLRSRELNSTLSRHSTALDKAEKQLSAYSSNFTAIYRAMMFVQRQLAKQRKINKSLNKKLSNVLLDVVEVNNVLTRAPNSPGEMMVGGGKLLAGAAHKNFEVQSVAKVRSCPGVTDQSTTYRDCAAVFEGGHKQSGVYYVKPTTSACPVPVWCDMDTPPGGWLVLQRRQDGSTNFKRDWAAYKDGFGNVAGEHWLGNDNMFLLSNQDHYQLRVDLWDFEGNRVHAIYTTFRVAGERDKYQLTVTGFSGSAHDSLYRHNHMAFSTPDRDNDGRREAHCASEWEAGWWFNNCWFALLNGAYHNRSDVAYRGIAWNHWKREQLRKTEMKIRPLGHAGTN